MDNCCVCYDPKIDALIYGVKFSLDKLSGSITSKLLNGYSCDHQAMKKVKILQNYLRVLEDENSNIVLGGSVCLDCDTLQKLSEKVRLITFDCDLEGRKDLIVDHSAVDAWVSANPYCVSRERWEKIAYTICKAFNLKITNIEEQCDFTFEVVRNLISCDIILAISVFKQMCNLKLKVNRDIYECKIDFDILVNETNCNIDFKTYRKFIDCNLSFDVIKTIYENECSIEINNGVLSLITPLSTYPLEDLNFSGIPDLNILKKLNVDTSNTEYIKNPQAFINKLKQDYTDAS